MIIFVADSISEVIYSKLKLKGYVIKVISNQKTYVEIANHPDVQVCPLRQDLFIDEWCYKQLSHEDKKALALHGKIHRLSHCLGEQYPDSIRFNGVLVGDQFIHNLKHTATPIKEYLESHHILTQQVNQGYTGCNTICLPDRSNNKGIGIITEDEGIYKELSELSTIQVLLIKPGAVLLDGFDYGFIGGTAGVIGDTVYFNGAVHQHPEFQRMSAFIMKYGYQIVEDSERLLMDCGSILCFGS
jgi:hypothetical protein